MSKKKIKRQLRAKNQNILLGVATTENLPGMRRKEKKKKEKAGFRQAKLSAELRCEAGGPVGMYGCPCVCVCGCSWEAVQTTENISFTRPGNESAQCPDVCDLHERAHLHIGNGFAGFWFFFFFFCFVRIRVTHSAN